MELRDNVKYAKTHEWVKELGDGVVEIGITDFAQDALGDIVFINLPEVDDEVVMETPFCDVESVKAVSDVYSPVTGVICQVNEELADNPALINESAFDAWIIRVKDVKEHEDFLSAEEYETFANEEA
ncbi:glycine cleavage system protein GcvH [Bacilliculturomica massiliensis]|uniref:glycine cleavage system protein GcvH n=1 Tax=Bacilliculturomica massiliensis TaxID=1917867 RepID=UPI001031D71D|nr:glycine cleavage system protein GcvH [Bacilliculturomica massiliensis]